MKNYSLIFLCIFLPCILYAETSSNIRNNVKIILNEGNWVPKHSLDVLESKNRDYMSTFVPDIERFNIDMVALLDDGPGFDPNKYPEILYWYERGDVIEPIKIDKNRFYIGFTYQNYITISDAIYVGDMVKFTGVVADDPAENMLDWSKLMENEIFDMFFIFDEDYLHVYINEVSPENLFYTFCRIDDVTVSEFKMLMSDNTCDLSNVTWPRYADGTSDYDDKITLTHKVENIYRTTDNLRIRHEEGLAGTPLFTLPKDTPIKILKLGKKETIDNITANWLQVEVAEDTIDTAGKEVEKGAVGWCFGGYVTTNP